MILEHVTTNKTLEESIRDINKQVLETKCTLNLGQLLKAILDIKGYILNPVSSKHVLLESTVASITIDHQMVVIHVQIGKNFIENVLIDGGFGVSFNIEKLKVQLGLSKPKHAPYNLHMVDQTITKPLGLIKDFEILAHGIFYVVTFTVI